MSICSSLSICNNNNKWEWRTKNHNKHVILEKQSGSEREQKIIVKNVRWMVKHGINRKEVMLLSHCVYAQHNHTARAHTKETEWYAFDIVSLFVSAALVRSVWSSVKHKNTDMMQTDDKMYGLPSYWNPFSFIRNEWHENSGHWIYEYTLTHIELF